MKVVQAEDDGPRIAGRVKAAKSHRSEIAERAGQRESLEINARPGTIVESIEFHCGRFRPAPDPASLDPKLRCKTNRASEVQKSLGLSLIHI